MQICVLLKVMGDGSSSSLAGLVIEVGHEQG